MLFIKSKIQFFESKSQPFMYNTCRLVCCLSSQRYNFLKANHNWEIGDGNILQLFIKSKIQFFESKSQLYLEISKGLLVVYQVKDTIFWKQITTGEGKCRNVRCCLSSQRYNFLKANHNQYFFIHFLNVVVYQVKDTIFWKQITTRWCIIS